MIHAIFKRRGIFKTPRYDRKNFIKVWNDVMGKHVFSDSKTKLMITTVDLVSDTNIFYKSWHPEFVETLYHTSHIVERSFAAPLYFGQIIDYDKQMVYSDGGIGNANLPLNEAKLQAESFGWYDNETVEIHAVGTLYDGYTPTFNSVASGRWLKQVMDFIKPMSGGLARAQSRADQIRMMGYICKHNNNIKFKYWDNGVDKKFIKMDKLKYLQFYKKQGILMAKEPIIEFN
jgi:patatin-like phospholipase/acyl hydrolase